MERKKLEKKKEKKRKKKRETYSNVVPTRNRHPMNG